MPEDKIYTRPRRDVVDFVFDQAVADVFPDMITRSVPGYRAIVDMIGLIAGNYAQAGSKLYDLGCSLGAATLAMRHRVASSDCRIIAVDNATAMIERCRLNVEQDGAELPVEIVCQDIQDIAIERAAVVVLSFTLQFVPVVARRALIATIYSGLLPGGCLLVSEKIRFADPQMAALTERLHRDFKKANGYSDLEISQKREALENILIPETEETHHRRLRAAGFHQVHTWFRCLNFVAMIAIK